MTAKPGQLRTGIWNWELPVSVTAFFTDYHQRQPFQIWQKPTKFRIHFSNHAQWGDSYAPGAVTNIALYIQKAAVDANGELNGNFTTTPVLLGSGGSLPSGSGEYITPWIDRSTFPLNPGIMYQVSSAFTGSSQLVIGGGLSWSNQTRSDAANTTATMTRSSSQRLMQMWVEYQYADDGSPFLFMVSNSKGSSSNLSTESQAEFTSLHNMWAAQKRGIAVSIAAAGTFGAAYDQVGGRWAVYDGCEIPIQPDAVLYHELVSSDVINEATNYTASLATHRSVVGRGKTKFPNARHISTNISPRSAFTGTSSSGIEKQRIDINKQLHLLAGGVDACIDNDSMVTDFADPGRIRAIYDADGTHGNARWHERIARIIPVERRSIG
jgi:hypothetical protein